jgi:hypothetical protein
MNNKEDFTDREQYEEELKLFKLNIENQPGESY